MANRRLANRLALSSSNVWVSFNSLAEQYCEVDMVQGQPDYAPMEYILKTMSEVVLEGNKYLQYTREQGHLRLVKAIAALHGPLLGREIDPLNEVIVTHGAYEGLTVSFLSLINPGDEVILIEPCYNSYVPMVRVADGVPVFVPLRPVVPKPTKSSEWTLDPKELENKFTSKTKMIVLNTPHNPIGKVFSKEELEVIAALCIKHDVICLSDEVYEWLVYPEASHLRIATLPGMWERTITISSASKSFSVTGWRVGWAIGPKDLIDCLMIMHQNGDCVCSTPAQEAIARVIETEMTRLNHPDGHLLSQATTLLSKRNLLAQILKDAGFTPCIPEAGYFILADWTEIVSNESIEDGSCDTSDFKFAKWLIKNHKVGGIPPSDFCEENKDICSKYIRFCFFRVDETLYKLRDILEKM